jgi:cell division protein ZapA
MADKPDLAEKANATEKPSLVHVEIFGQTYAVRAGADPRYVEQIAAHVDAQMREVSRSGAVDSVRIAVMAALNIADECFTLRGAAREAEERAGQKAAELARRLGAALGD